MGTTKFDRKLRSRLSVLLFFFVFSLTGLFGRIYYLKTVKGEEYEQKAKTQQVTRYGDTTIAPNRGAIVDRNMQAMAISTTVYNIILDCRVVSLELTPEEQETVLRALSDTFPDELSYTDLQNYIAINPQTQRPNEDTNWKVLVKKVERETVETLQEKKLKGVVYQKDSKREYPLKTIAAQVIGFIRGDSKLGLEKQYNQEMTGTPGRSFVTYDSSHNANTQEIPAEDGNTIITTLDFTMQQFAEQAAIEAKAAYNCESAAVLIMDPNTGEIYAMAESERFDNNAPSVPPELETDESFRETWEAMTQEEQIDYLNSVWNNFNTTFTYEPGSIFKPMVLAAALEENVISTNDSFFCGGFETVADRDIYCSNRRGHGQQSVEQSLASSCNVAFMHIGQKLGKELFYKYQKDFGFGEKTGIDLPAEASAQSLMYSLDKIGPVELATMSFGQSFNCTSIQAVTAFSAVINGGKILKPYVVSQVIDSKGNVVKENKPHVVRKVISQQTSDIVRNFMQTVVDTGTGKKAKINGYEIGGKTGTAEQGVRDKGKNKEYVVSYISFLPVENPQYVVLAAMNRPMPYVDGQTSAAPMTQTILTELIKYKNIEPQYETEGATPFSGKAEKVVIEDYVGQNVSDALDEIEILGLDFEVVGTGTNVVNQAPHGGTEMEKGSQVILYVERGEGEIGTVKMPDVKGKTMEEAVTFLTDEGFATVVEGDETGIVVKQRPAKGVTVEEGCEVKLQIQKEEEKEPEEP